MARTTKAKKQQRKAAAKKPEPTNGVRPKITARLRRVTPKLAGEWLKANRSNRKLRPSLVAKYRRAIEQGMWHTTGESIKFDTDGNLLDGQHRLAAVHDSGIAVDMLVIFGVPPENQRYMDTGKVRQLSDVLKMYYADECKAVTSNSNRVAAVLRSLRVWETGDTAKASVTDEMIELLKKYAGSIDWYYDLTNGAPAISSGHFAGPIIWVHGNGWEELAQVFASEIESGTNLGAGNPALAMYRWYMHNVGKSGQRKRCGGADLSIRCFNALSATDDGRKITSKSLTLSAKGFDYFNTQVNPPPKRRPKTMCHRTGGCTFDVGRNKAQLCTLHNRFRRRPGGDK